MATRYQHTMEMLPKIKEMLAAGMTQKEVEKVVSRVMRKFICSLCE